MILLCLVKNPTKWRQRCNMTIAVDWDAKPQNFTKGLNKPRSELAKVRIVHVPFMIWVFHFKSFVIVTSRYLMLSTFSSTVPSRV